jgi:hypothetical protein
MGKNCKNTANQELFNYVYHAGAKKIGTYITLPILSQFATVIFLLRSKYQQITQYF